MIHTNPTKAGTYDPQTGEFRFTYTFANLPGTFGSTVGQVQQPTPDQQQLVRRLLGQVSQVLSQITDGRAKIGRLDYVDNIKDADLVISLTGRPQSPGWAHKRAFESQTGQIALYYQTLEPFITQDVVFTVVHELCHYIFGLDDMYGGGLYPRGVPVRPGPGSLMDNYFSSQRGFMGRMDNAQEWQEAIRAADRPRSQGKSSQEIIDEFFTKRGSPPRSATTVTTAEQVKATVVASAVAKTQEELRKETEENGSARVLFGSRPRLLARENLQRILDQFNRGRTEQVVFGRDQLQKTIDLVGRVSSAVELSQPESISESVFKAIQERARALGVEVASNPNERTRRSTIERGLRNFLRALIAQGLINSREFGAAPQRDLIQHLAIQESLSAQERALTRLSGVTDLTAQLQLGIADDVIRILDALDEPGIPQRLDSLRRIQEQLAEFGIPGRNFEQFGTRRSRFINPDPIDSRFDFVLTQAGVFPYTTIRDRGFEDFARLIEPRRGRIELVTPSFQQIGAPAAPRAVRIDRPDLELEQFRRDQRQIGLQSFLNNVASQLDRNRLENIAVLVPPGGLPQTLGDRLRFLQADLRTGTDVRLDIVMVGPEDIDEELRSLAVDSGGVVLTVADIDEIGAIAQFLRNEQAQGSWVIIPQQGTIPAQAANERPKPLVIDPESIEGLDEELRKRFGDVVVILPKASTLPETPTNIIVPLDQESVDQPLVDRIKGQQVELNKKLAVNYKNIKEFLNENTVIPLEVRNRIDETYGITGRLYWAFRRLAELADKLPSASPQERKGPRGHNLELLRQLGSIRDDFDRARNIRPIQANNPISKKQRDLIDGLEPLFPEIESLIRQFERTLEVSLIESKDDLPIYARIKRAEQAALRRKLEFEATGDPTRLEPPRSDEEHRVRLARFWAEGEAEFEFVIGLSRPLPRVFDTNGTEIPEARVPRFRLYSDLGALAMDSAKIVPDDDNSTPTLLVYRVRYSKDVTGSGLTQGWYNPVLEIDPRTLKKIKESEPINFTFSIASQRENIQLIAELDQEVPPGQLRKGTLMKQEGPAVIRVQVAGPSPILDAQMIGFVQRINRGFDAIDTFALSLQDNGVSPDLEANDGIYAAVIPLDGIDESRQTEFRVFIQAETITQGRYIELDKPATTDEELTALEQKAARGSTVRAVREATELAEGRALQFQRATKIHFLVKP